MRRRTARRSTSPERVPGYRAARLLRAAHQHPQPRFPLNPSLRAQRSDLPPPGPAPHEIAASRFALLAMALTEAQIMRHEPRLRRSAAARDKAARGDRGGQPARRGRSRRADPRRRQALAGCRPAHPRRPRTGLSRGCATQGPARGGIDAFLHEYELSTPEGVALMCLAEALLRIPDSETIDRLIRDKLGRRRLGRAISAIPNRCSSTPRPGR